MGMIEDLVEVLDRAHAALDAEEDLDFPLNLFRFHELLTRDARTSAILETLRQEEAASKGKLDREHAEVATTLTAIVDELELDAIEHFEPVPDDEHEPGESLEQIRIWLARATARAPDPYLVGKERTDVNELSKVIQAVDAVAERANRPDVRERLRAAKRRFDHANRARRIFYLTSAGTALVMLERHLGDFHPPPLEQGEEAEYAHFARTRKTPLGKVAETIFGVGRTNPEDDLSVQAFLDGMRSDTRRVYEHVRGRIGAERSLLAVFERYRQRCVWYDAERLRAIAASGPGKPEDRLTETLAAYLFDHGLNPLTRPLVGKVQPDLLAPGSRFSFYVEAKQYASATPGYLLKGMHQVWDMLDELRGKNLDVSEAFYVIYRRGGPRYSFEPRVQHRDRVVHVLVIDIAPTDERGSNAPPTQSFGLADLIPAPFLSPGPKKPQKKSKTKRTAK
jgi:hypothetical protein